MSSKNRLISTSGCNLIAPLLKLPLQKSTASTSLWVLGVLNQKEWRDCCYAIKACRVEVKSLVSLEREWSIREHHIARMIFLNPDMFKTNLVDVWLVSSLRGHQRVIGNTPMPLNLVVKLVTSYLTQQSAWTFYIQQTYSLFWFWNAVPNGNFIWTPAWDYKA